MILTKRTLDQIADLDKEYGSMCDKGCEALSGICVGRGVSDPFRAIIVVGEGNHQHMWDLSVKQVLDVPRFCPFFKGSERR